MANQANRLSVTHIMGALLEHPCSCQKDHPDTDVVELFVQDKGVHECLRAGLEIIPNRADQSITIELTRSALLALRKINHSDSTFTSTKTDDGPFFTWSREDGKHTVTIAGEDLCAILRTIIHQKTKLRVTISVDDLATALETLEKAA